MVQSLSGKKRENMLFFLFYVVFFACLSSYSGFTVSYLSQFGYTALQVNVLNAILCVCSLVFQPILGFITDTYIPVKKYIIGALVVSTAAVFLLPMAAPTKNIILVYLAISFMAIVCTPIAFLMDTWCVNLRENRPYLDYGKVRAGGSFGFSLSSLIMGNIVVMLANFNVLFIVSASCAATAVLIAFFIPSVPCLNKDGVEKDKSISFSQVVKLLMRNKFFMIFLISNILFFIAYRPLLVNVPYKILSLGGDSSQIGGAAAISVICEIPVLFFMRKLVKKTKISYLYIFACAVVILRCTTLMFAENIFMVFLSQFFQSIANGIVLSAPIEYISRALPQKILATSTSFYVAMTQGVASIIATLLGGVIMEYLGFESLVFVMLIVSILSLITFAVPIYFIGRKDRAKIV